MPVQKTEGEIILTQNSPLVGAIRWDGWVGNKGSWQIGPIVERTLGPSKFHYRAPFFSIVTGKDSISIDGTTQEIMDKEIVFATEAGIDYWAYCWYPDGCGLELARKLHQTSILANDVKWCVILGTFEVNVLNNYGASLVNDFARENYQKVLGGRPLIYLYSSDLTRAGLDKLRAMTIAKNLKTPYVVVMAWDAASAADYCQVIGADAISSYAALGNNNRPFTEVIPPQSKANWEKFAAKKEVVPWVCTGWNAKPRMESENPWSSYYSDATNCQDATANDIKDFLLSAIDWTVSHRSKVVANTLIMYAWNEHDEGYGAICPTLGTDGMPDTERLDSVRVALQGRMKDTIIIRSFQLNVVVKDVELNSPISDARVMINKDTVISDQEGISYYNSVPENFVLSIENDKYLPVTRRSISVNSDTTLIFYLIQRGFNVSLTLMDNKTHEPFWGARVTVDSNTQVTDGSGQVLFSLRSGTYEYTINKISYQVETGNISITSDTSIIFYLTQTHAEAKFRLYDGLTPLNNAIIKVNSDSLLTNAIGIALFKLLPLNYLYSYSIIKEGYNSNYGEFFLSKDTLIDISAERNNLGSELLLNPHNMKLWPNPASGFLHCSFPTRFLNSTFIITDMAGNEIYSVVLNETEFSLSLRDFHSGTYFLRVISDYNYTGILIISK